MARTLVRQGAEQAMADYMRNVSAVYGEISEPSLRDAYAHDLAAPDDGLAASLRAMRDLPPGTLGHEYTQFIERHGFQFPGETTSAPAVFVAHDMCHVSPATAPPVRRRSRSAPCSSRSTTATRTGSSSSGACRSTRPGSYDINGFVPKTATLDRDGAAALLAEAFRRGVDCTDDFTAADHLALADQPLDEVRTRFGIPARSA